MRRHPLTCSFIALVWLVLAACNPETGGRWTFVDKPGTGFNTSPTFTDGLRDSLSRDSSGATGFGDSIMYNCGSSLRDQMPNAAAKVFVSYAVNDALHSTVDYTAWLGRLRQTLAYAPSNNWYWSNVRMASMTNATQRSNANKINLALGEEAQRNSRLHVIDFNGKSQAWWFNDNIHPDNNCAGWAQLYTDAAA